MAEDPEKKEEAKLEFDSTGQSVAYISLDQARVLAIEHARDNTDFYGPNYAGMNLAWEVVSAEESDDYYDIRLSFRPAGRFRGEPGTEQFIFDKTGELRVRQFLDEPTGLESPPARTDPTTAESAPISSSPPRPASSAASPARAASPLPRDTLTRASRSRQGGEAPGRQHPILWWVAVGGGVLVVVIILLGVLFGDGSGGGDGDEPQAGVLDPTSSPTPTNTQVPPSVARAPSAIATSPVTISTQAPLPTSAQQAATPTQTPLFPTVPTHTPTPSPTLIPPTPTPTPVPRPTTDPAAIANLLSQPWVQGVAGAGMPHTAMNEAWNREVRSLVLSPDHSAIYATAPERAKSFYDALSRSADGGRTWEVSAVKFYINNQPSGPLETDSLVFDPADPQIVYGGHGTWRSENGGRSWVRSPSVPDRPFVAYQDVLYAGQFRSTDRGETWRPSLFLAGSRIPLGNPGSPSVLYSVLRLEPGPTYSLMMSTDGSSWEGVRILPEMEGQLSQIRFIIDYADPPNIYVGTGEALFKANALEPKEWSRISWPTEKGPPPFFAVHPTNPDILAISARSQIFVAFDGGSSWIELPKPEYMVGNVIYEASPGELVITGGVEPRVCVGTNVGVWCHQLSLE